MARMSNPTVLPVSSLETHLGYWLRFVSNHVSHAFKVKIQGRGVTVAEWVVLRALYDSDEMNPSQLARQLGMTRGAISKLADRLIAKNLVACTPDPHDHRFQSLALTAAGRRIVPQLASLADENDAEFFGHLRADQRAALMSAMKELVRQNGLSRVPIE